MDLQELQAVLAQSLLGPADVRTPPELPPSLAGIPPGRLAAFSRLLEAKRRERVGRALPLSTRLLGDHFPTLFADYATAYPPTVAGRRADVAAFAAHAAEALRDGSEIAPGLAGSAVADLLRYEALRHHVGRQPPPMLRTPAALSMAVVRQLRPIVVPGLGVATFGWPVDRWLAALAGGVSAPPEPDTAHLILARFSEPPYVRARRVNAATVGLLSRCDGRATLEAVVTDLARDLGLGEKKERHRLEEECESMLMLLEGEGLVTWGEG